MGTDTVVDAERKVVRRVFLDKTRGGRVFVIDAEVCQRRPETMNIGAVSAAVTEGYRNLIRSRCTAKPEFFRRAQCNGADRDRACHDPRAVRPGQPAETPSIERCTLSLHGDGELADLPGIETQARR